MSGYFLVYRGLHDHELFKSNTPLSKFEAWLWLIEHANFVPSVYRHGTTIVTIPRGSLGSSYRSLARHWKWSVDRVIRELKIWKSQEMVDVETRQGFLQITICKYELYQNPACNTATPARQQHDARATATSTNLKKGKKVIQETKDIPPAQLPEWLPIPDWEAFLELRRNLKKPLTGRAMELILKDLERLRNEGYDPALVLQQSVKNSWQGVFKLKGDYHGSPGYHPRSQPGQNKADRAKAAVVDALLEIQSGNPG